MRSNRAVATLVIALSLSACGKSVGKNGRRFSLNEPPPSDKIPTPGSSPTPVTPVTPSCTPHRWSFTQPQDTIFRSVDLLFVVDTSTSLAEERERLAATLPSFLTALPTGTDLRIGVMPAHGGASPLSGSLYSAPGTPVVLDTATQSVASIQTALASTLRQTPADADEANGEALLASFARSLVPTRVSAIQQQGFYRADAALSLVFLTDENDICYRPLDHGFTAFPDYVPDGQNWEQIAFTRHCGSVTVASVIDAAKRLKGNQKLSWAGIVHERPELVPSSGEDAIGHGIIELVQASLDGLIFDIADAAGYRAGLTRLGSVVTRQLNLELSFVLDGTGTIDPTSIQVTVDGAHVPARFDQGSRSVELSVDDAGRGGSSVEITACSAGP